MFAWASFTNRRGHFRLLANAWSRLQSDGYQLGTESIMVPPRKKSAAKIKPEVLKSDRGVGAALQSCPPVVRAEVLSYCARPPNLLTNAIDSTDATWYSFADGQLHLKFHLLLCFLEGGIASLQLIRCKNGVETFEEYPLPATNLNSPGVAAQQPNLIWASKSRFAVDAAIRFPDLSAGDTVIIRAQVAGQWRPVARVFITGHALE